MAAQSPLKLLPAHLRSAWYIAPSGFLIQLGLGLRAAGTGSLSLRYSRALLAKGRPFRFWHVSERALLFGCRCGLLDVARGRFALRGTGHYSSVLV
jgi:hypothetical protein